MFNIFSADEVQKRCYLRLTLADEPGAMASYECLGWTFDNVASVIQKEKHPNGAVPVVILTEQAREADFGAATEAISLLSICKEEPLRMRLEDFEDEGR